MFATTKSIRGHACAQVFADGRGYSRLYPMHKKQEAGQSL